MKKSASILLLAVAAFVFSSCGPSVSDIDGNSYGIVTIGNQDWMTKNLNVSTFRNGDPIPRAFTEEEWLTAATEQSPAWCYYDNDSLLADTYGKLYNWFAVTDPRGLAPEGWHVPSDEEWQTLVDELGGLEASNALKVDGIEQWRDPNYGATNESGFSAVPGGFRDEQGAFHYRGVYGLFWTTTEYDSLLAWHRQLHYLYTGVNRFPQHKTNGFSVRCVQD